ncbi:SdrD B-like domain-containing protein [Achromobacter xylosoxidans]
MDFVDYALELNNQTGGLLAGATFEDLPAAGFVYQQGSARVITAAGASAVEPLLTPNGKGGLSMRFELPSLRLADQEALRLTYRMRVNVGALQGDGVNRARATSGALRSNEASARVKVVGGVFAEEAFVIGKVTLDCNRNGIQDEEAGEIGIPGVRLYLEDGTFAITDSEGKYSFYGLRPLTHVLKLDLTTLPQGAVLGSPATATASTSRPRPPSAPARPAPASST